MLASTITLFASVASRVLAHGVSEHQTPIAGPFEALWYNKLPGDGGTQVTN
jgi:agmatinase